MNANYQIRLTFDSSIIDRNLTEITANGWQQVCSQVAEPKTLSRLRTLAADLFGR